LQLRSTAKTLDPWSDDVSKPDGYAAVVEVSKGAVLSDAKTTRSVPSRAVFAALDELLQMP